MMFEKEKPSTLDGKARKDTYLTHRPISINDFGKTTSSQQKPMDTKHISHMLGHSQKPISSNEAISKILEGSTTQSMPIEWVNEIFRCFQSSYGFQWSSRHSTTEAWNRTKQDWARLLLGMTYEEVVKGLNNLPPGNPPDAASFKQLGQKPKLNERTHHGAYKEFKPDREFKKASLATHREHYEKCMAILGKKPQPLPEGVTPEQEEQPSLGMRPR